MPQKTPVNFAIWQWALIGSGCTLLLVSSAYGALNLIENFQGSGAIAITKSSPTQGKSVDAANTSPSVNTTSATNISPIASNTSDKVAQNPSNNTIAGTWLIKTTSTYEGKDTFEVVVTSDGRLIIPDFKNSSRGIESAINIRRISTNTNETSSDVIAAVAGTWLFDIPTNKPIPMKAVISNYGVVTLSDPNRSHQSERFAKITRKISNNTTDTFANIVTFADLSRENTASGARQSEARTYVGAMNRAQQTFYLEKVRFASSLDELVLGISAETPNYSYRVSAINSTSPLRRVTYQIGQAKQPSIKSYIGAVRVVKQGNETTVISILCGTNSATTSEPPLPILVGDNKLECAAGTQPTAG